MPLRLPDRVPVELCFSLHARPPFDLYVTPTLGSGSASMYSCVIIDGFVAKLSTVAPQALACARRFLGVARRGGEGRTRRQGADTLGTLPAGERSMVSAVRQVARINEELQLLG